MSALLGETADDRLDAGQLSLQLLPGLQSLLALSHTHQSQLVSQVDTSTVVDQSTSTVSVTGCNNHK